MKITYYLWVDSLETAFRAINTLSFCTHLGGDKIRIVNSDRIVIKITQEESSKGAIIVLTGAYTLNEMREINGLGQYEYEPIRQDVIKLVAETVAYLETKGVRLTHQILGKTK